jgi:lipoprotein-anchoring transpeptidase ErfK/SrfK
VKSRREPKPNRSKSSSWRKKAGLVLLPVGLGFGLFWWITPSPRAGKTTGAKVQTPAPGVAKPALAHQSDNKVALKTIKPSALTPSPAPIVIGPSSSNRIKIPGPALAPFPTQGSRDPPEDLFPRPVHGVAEAQIALARLGISSGSIDGRLGTQTGLALQAFQRINHLPETGQLDPRTRETLLLTRSPFGRYIVSESDLKRLQPLSETWAGKAQQTALEYETILELVAEKSRADPEFLRRLNPPAVFLSPPAGAAIFVPDTELGELTPCEFIKIGLSRRILEAYDSRSNLVAHFPCSIAQHVEKRPEGELHVASIVPNPNYTFDPALFPGSPEASLEQKLVLPPGPNNPVGIAWIGLDKPGYGIHGTPLPEQVGRTESHGCFRLANWNADHLLKIVRIGTPVYVE